MAKGSEESRSGEELLYRWLSAPLLIAVVGAVLINYVIPQINSKSQNHQRALEIKTALVREMSESAADAAVTGQLIATDVIAKRAGGDPNAAFQSELRDWQVASARIRSEIEGYFPKTSLGQEWASFSEGLTETYHLSSSGTGFADRCASVRDVQRFLGVRLSCGGTQPGPISWSALAGASEKRGRTGEFRTSYIRLADRIMRAGDDLVKRVLAADVSGL